MAAEGIFGEEAIEQKVFADIIPGIPSSSLERYAVGTGDMLVAAANYVTRDDGMGTTQPKVTEEPKMSEFNLATMDTAAVGTTGVKPISADTASAVDARVAELFSQDAMRNQTESRIVKLVSLKPTAKSLFGEKPMMNIAAEQGSKDNKKPTIDYLNELEALLVPDNAGEKYAGNRRAFENMKRMVTEGKPVPVYAPHNPSLAGVIAHIPGVTEGEKGFTMPIFAAALLMNCAGLIAENAPGTITGAKVSTSLTKRRSAEKKAPAVPRVRLSDNKIRSDEKSDLVVYAGIPDASRMRKDVKCSTAQLFYVFTNTEAKQAFEASKEAGGAPKKVRAVRLRGTFVGELPSIAKDPSPLFVDFNVGPANEFLPTATRSITEREKAKEAMKNYMAYMVEGNVQAVGALASLVKELKSSVAQVRTEGFAE
jgi:hypothetical protein